MGLKTFFGAAFIAFGPPIILFAFTILRRPQDVLVFLSSAFFWLLSLLFSGCVWRVIAVNNTSPGSDAALYQLALGALFAVAFQEFFRYVFYKLLRRTEKDLLTLIGDSSKLTRHRLAYVSGMGYGAMSGAFAFGNVLADSLGPGIVSNIDQFGGEFHVKEEFFLVSGKLCERECHSAVQIWSHLGLLFRICQNFKQVQKWALPLNRPPRRNCQRLAYEFKLCDPIIDDS
ncbi:gamma-secretase subunit APH-1B-like isoform X2 [Corticium candelabrum]|uniref:gamma-secretase subunit APH-1B-like isoform X2 n=1 Tax=Corticium candelabrum TaxID=121492 RepID=UPI002E26DCAB|nr:gamma-secretase subunit APH-1B-like isoform X2 [Corticium candelabrum]